MTPNKLSDLQPHQQDAVVSVLTFLAKRHPNTGASIVIEGPTGSGKSTVIEYLQRKLGYVPGLTFHEGFPKHHHLVRLEPKNPWIEKGLEPSPRCPSTAKAGEWIRNRKTGEVVEVVNNAYRSLAYKEGGNHDFVVVVRRNGAPSFSVCDSREWEIVEPVPTKIGSRPLPACGSTCDCPEDGPCKAEALLDRDSAAMRTMGKDGQPRWPEKGDLAISKSGFCCAVISVERSLVALHVGCATSYHNAHDLIELGWRFEGRPLSEGKQ